jgi:hypothetical protein
MGPAQAKLQKNDIYTTDHTDIENNRYRERQTFELVTKRMKKYN